MTTIALPQLAPTRTVYAEPCAGTCPSKAPPGAPRPPASATPPPPAPHSEPAPQPPSPSNLLDLIYHPEYHTLRLCDITRQRIDQLLDLVDKPDLIEAVERIERLTQARVRILRAEAEQAAWGRLFELASNYPVGPRQEEISRKAASQILRTLKSPAPTPKPTPPPPDATDPPSPPDSPDTPPDTPPPNPGLPVHRLAEPGPSRPTNTPARKIHALAGCAHAPDRPTIPTCPPPPITTRSDAL